MPKPRLSYDTAKVKGSVKVNRGRFEARKSAPATEGEVGNSPKHFNSAQKSIWKEITQAIPSGVAGSHDRMAIEMASVLLAQFRADPLNIQASRISILMQLLSRLGLDPQARTRLHTPQPETPKEEDEWSKFEITAKSPRNTRLM